MGINYGLVARVLGLLSLAIGGFMFTAVPWALYFGEYAVLLPLVESVAACEAAGLVLIFLGRKASDRLYQRDALLMVGLGWAWVAFLGTFPFVISGELGWVDAYFEIMSGFTTTGSSVMTALDAAPRSLVFWRNLTHWIGGLGIVVMLIAVLPYLGTGGKTLFLKESTGPDPRGIRPRVRETARLLYKIYIGLTILGTLAYMAAGMNFYDALNHCFGALATGGFSTRYASIGGYDSVPIELVSIVLMLVGATNFALYFQMWKGDWRAPLRDTEFKVFMAIFIGASLLATINLMGVGGQVPEVQRTEAGIQSRADELAAAGALPVAAALPLSRQQLPFGSALRNATFQVTSMMTDTGYVGANFEQWPYFSRLLLFIVTMTGGCVGSTSGGIKIVRVVILAKMIRLWIQRAYRPYLVRAIRYNGQVIDDELQRRIFAFFTLYTAWIFFAMLVVSAFGLPLDSAFGAVVATTNNCGPGLEYTYADFSILPPALKVFLSFNMLVGRLELLTILTLLTPTFWRNE